MKKIGIKAKIPKDIAEVIERTRDIMSVFDCEEDLNDTQFTLYRVLDNVNKQYHEKWLNEGENLELLVKAIRDGYEVEKTKEEGLLDYYQSCKRVSNHFSPESGGDGRDMHYLNKGAVNGVFRTLETLGIKIKGINI